MVEEVLRIVLGVTFLVALVLVIIISLTGDGLRVTYWPKWWRLLFGANLIIMGAATTAYKWVLFLAGGPLIHQPRDSSVLGPLVLVLGIGMCFLRPWEEAEQALRRGELLSLRMRVPPRWVRLVLLAVGATAANAILLTVLYLMR
jgi:hypothetical protein